MGTLSVLCVTGKTRRPSEVPPSTTMFTLLVLAGLVAGGLCQGARPTCPPLYPTTCSSGDHAELRYKGGCPYTACLHDTTPIPMMDTTMGGGPMPCPPLYRMTCYPGEKLELNYYGGCPTYECIMYGTMAPFIPKHCNASDANLVCGNGDSPMLEYDMKGCPYTKCIPMNSNWGTVKPDWGTDKPYWGTDMPPDWGSGPTCPPFKMPNCAPGMMPVEKFDKYGCEHWRCVQSHVGK